MILTALHYGRANARTKKEIAQDLGWSTRSVEHAIEAARKSGEAAICSSAEGYWRASSVEEYRANVDTRRRRALGQLVTVRGERLLLRRWEAAEAVPLAFRWDAA